jgi:hypothetical protein
MTSVFLPIMSKNDQTVAETQSGAALQALKAFVYCVIRDGGGTPIAGVQVQAVNDAGLAGGQIYYKTGTGFNGAAGTNATGQLIIFNLDPGRVNLRCTAGASGNLHVRVEADGTTSAVLFAGAAAAKVKLSGITRDFANPLGTPLAAVDVGGIMTGAPFPVLSDGTGNYTTPAASVDAGNLLLLRLTKTGGLHAPTINTVLMGATDLVYDLSIVSLAERASADFTPAAVALDPTKGIIRGILAPMSGTLDGYTVVATNEAGAVTGTVSYGDTINGKPGASATTTLTGIFYVHNADPGPVLLRATKSGMAGSTLVEVEADGVTMLHPLQLRPAAATNASIQVLGSTVDLFSGAIDGVSVSFRGLTNATVSDGFGSYVVGSMPANTDVVARCVK